MIAASLAPHFWVEVVLLSPISSIFQPSSRASFWSFSWLLVFRLFGCVWYVILTPREHTKLSTRWWAQGLSVLGSYKSSDTHLSRCHLWWVLSFLSTSILSFGSTYLWLPLHPIDNYDYSELLFSRRLITMLLFIPNNMQWRRLLLMGASARGISFPFVIMVIPSLVSGSTRLRLMVLLSATELIMWPMAFSKNMAISRSHSKSVSFCAHFDPLQWPLPCSMRSSWDSL